MDAVKQSVSNESLDSLDSKLSLDLLDEVRFYTIDPDPMLATAICERLGLQLGPLKIEYFLNGECRPVIGESVSKKQVFLLGSCAGGSRSVNDHLIALILTISAMRRAGVARITVIMPNYPYARQDKKDSPRAAISAQTVAQMLEMAGIDHLITLDLHSATIQGFFSNRVPVDNLYAIGPVTEFMSMYLSTYLSQQTGSRFIAISPDEGAFKRTRKYAEKLGLKYLCISKTRDYSQTNKVEEAQTQLFGDVSILRDSNAIIFDDMCDTFGTIQTAASVLEKAGAIGIYVVVTHGILSGPALSRLANTPLVKGLICSDSLPQQQNLKQSPKLRVFSVAPLLAEVVRRRVTGESVSEMFPHL